MTQKICTQDGESYSSQQESPPVAVAADANQLFTSPSASYGHPACVGYVRALCWLG